MNPTTFISSFDLLYPERDPDTGLFIKTNLRVDQIAFLKQYKITLSDGYIGMLRAYCNNLTIWQTSWSNVIIAAMDKDIKTLLDPVPLVQQLHLWIDEMMTLPEAELKARLETHHHLFSS